MIDNKAKKLTLDSGSFSPDCLNITMDIETIATYHVPIDEEIQNPVYYRNIISLLNNASETDTIMFHLSTPGGELDTTLAMLNAIRETSANTISVIEAMVASAGTLFPMVTDGVIVQPHGCLMFHPASYGYCGQMNTVKSFVDFHDKRLRNILHDFYKGFFSKEEIDNLINNSLEIWMGDEEIINRLNNRDKVLKEASEQIEAEKPKKKSKKEKK